MPTADVFNHSAVGMLHLHHSATCFLYVTLCCPIPPLEKNLPLPIGVTHPTKEIIL